MKLSDLFLPAFILLFMVSAYTTLILVEYVNCGILGNIEGYPFGAEGPVGWNYITAEVYITSLKVEVALGAFLLLSICILVWKLKVKGLLLSFLLFLVFIMGCNYNESYFMKKLVFWII